jgi:hypothetical protein
MKKIITKILDFFKFKSPCCNSIMKNTYEYNGSQIYECSKCQKEWF